MDADGADAALAERRHCELRCDAPFEEHIHNLMIDDVVIALEDAPRIRIALLAETFNDRLLVLPVT